MGRIQDNLQSRTIYDQVRLLLAELVDLLVDGLSRSLTDQSDYLVVLIKDSVGTN